MTNLQGGMLDQLSERQVFAPSGEPYFHYDLREMQPDSEGRRRWYWELIIYDVAGGLNKQVGDYERDMDRSRASSLDTRFERTLCLPPLVTPATSPDPSSPVQGMYFAQCFDRTMIVANTLFAETSSSNPAIAAVTISGNPDDFTCAVPLIFGGAGEIRKLVLGRSAAAPVALTSPTGSLHSTTPHADLSSLWCAIPTFTNDGMLLLVSGASGSCYIRTLRQTSDWDVAPVQTSTPMRAGTSALGLALLGGGLGHVRAYWREPIVSGQVGTPVVGFERSQPFEIVSTDFEGNDKRPFSFEPQLGKLTWAELYRDGIVAHDTTGERLVWKNGAYSLDLKIFDERKPDSDLVYRVRGGWVIGDTLRARVVRTAVGDSSDNKWAIWEFDFDTFAWHQTSAWFAAADNGTMSHGGLPWSIDTRYLHHYEGGSWHRQLVTPAGVNTYTLRKTPGAGSGTGMAYEASGIWESPEWELPGLWGKTKSLAGIIKLGDIESLGTGGTPGKLTIASAGLTRVFTADSKYATEHVSEIQTLEENSFDRLQVTATMTQQSGGTDPTRHTGNALPLLLWGWAADDVKAEPPASLPVLPRR